MSSVVHHVMVYYYWYLHLALFHCQIAWGAKSGDLVLEDTEPAVRSVLYCILIMELTISIELFESRLPSRSTYLMTETNRQAYAKLGALLCRTHLSRATKFFIRLLLFQATAKTINLLHSALCRYATIPY